MLHNRGLIFGQMERWDEAIGMHQQAAAIFCETRDPHREAQATETIENIRSQRRT